MKISTRSLSLMTILGLFFVNNAITTEEADENKKPTIEVVIAEEKENKDEQEKEQKNNESVSAEELMLQTWFGVDTAKTLLRCAAVSGFASIPLKDLKKLIPYVATGKIDAAVGVAVDKKLAQFNEKEQSTAAKMSIAGHVVVTSIIDRILETEYVKKNVLAPLDENITARVMGDKKDVGCSSMDKTKFIAHIIGTKLVWQSIDMALVMGVKFLSSDKK